MKPKIVFLDEYSLAERDLSAVKALGDYTGYDMTAPDEVAARCADAEIVVTNKVRLDAATIAQLPHLRLICVAATGVNNIDLDAAAEHGVEVRNAAGYSTHSVAETTLGAAIALLKQQLKPEFLNRIDEIVMFEPLTHKDIERIVDIQLGIVRRMLSENGIRLEYSDKAREWIASAGYDPLYGARPVKRVIQRYVVNDLSKRILAGEVDRSKPIAIDAGQDGLTFSN